MLSRRSCILSTIVYCIAFLGFNVSVVLGQQSSSQLNISAGKVIDNDLLFKRFYSRDGLPDDRIRSIYQDSQGFLWVGTMNGLCKYDGYNFKKYYKSKKANSISGNWAYAICEDDRHNIWIGTKEGLNKFDTKQETFTSFLDGAAKQQKLASNIINTLQFDRFGKLWIGTPQGLANFDTASNTFKWLDSYPFNTNICKIISSYQNFIWIATNDGVVHYDVRNGKYQFYKIPVHPNPYGDKFWSMLEENKSLFITTGGDGLIRLPYNTVKNEYDQFERINNFVNKENNLEKTQVFDICKSKTGDFWLATGRGLAKIQNINSGSRSITFYRNNPLNDKSISYDQVFKVFIDRTNVLWCGTELGLDKLDLNLLPFNYYTFTDKYHTDQVRSIYTADGANIWFGTSKNGFYQYNIINNTGRQYKFKPDASPENFGRSILVNGTQVWVGTLGGAIKLSSFSSNSYTTQVAGKAVFALLKDSRSNIWMGTNTGLFKVDPKGRTVKYLPDGAGKSENRSGFVRVIYEDHTGKIWVGFENSGLRILDPNTGVFTKVLGDSGSSVFGSTIFSISESPQNTIWVGSESGLNKLTPASNVKAGHYNIKNYSEEDGLPDKSVNGIIADAKGNLWISTIKGLVNFNIQKQTFQRYLNNINFNYSCYYKLNDHSFLFGTTDGFIIFDPEAITVDNNPPQVVLSDFKLFNRSVGINQKVNGDVIFSTSIRNTSKITLDYYNNQFSFDFTALHFSNPAENKYAYQMKGFDKNWISTNADNRTATYTNLDAGTYTFKVKASNYSGRWNDVPDTIQVTILPPPWKSWWAIVLYVITACVLFYIGVRYVLGQIRQRNHMRFEKMEKEQLKNLNQMKVRFFTDVSHEFRTPLSLIVGPVEDLLSSNELSGNAKSKITLIYRNCKKLLYLIEELMTFQKMEQGMLKLKTVNTDIVEFVKEIYENFIPAAQKKEIDFHLLKDGEPYITSFDPGKMEMVLNNLIFNAFKFAPPGGTVNISVSRKEDSQVPANDYAGVKNWIDISVEDNGKGISAEEFNHLFERFFSETSIKGTGVGLSLTKDLVELHKGFIVAESEPGIKTSFRVFLPIDENTVSDRLTNDAKDYVYTPGYDVTVLIDEHVPVQKSASYHTIHPEEDCHTILMVDDNPEVLDYLEMIFDGRYMIAKAQNGVEAMEYIAKQQPDLIISDVMMPEMDGIELCKKVKNDVNTSHIPLILLTAKSTIESKIGGLEIGADDYIPKPFHPGMLKVKVEKLIETQQRLIDKYRADGGIIVPKNIAQNPLDEAFLVKVTASIKANMSNEEFSVEELGSMVAMSRSNLFRKLKAITGQTPIEFIYYIRLHHAMQLLLERKMNMSEIAYEVGFKNPSSFTKSFRKQFGKAPSEYLNSVLAAHR